jgi:hypothetical protein
MTLAEPSPKNEKLPEMVGEFLLWPMRGSNPRSSP